MGRKSNESVPVRVDIEFHDILQDVADASGLSVRQITMKLKTSKSFKKSILDALDARGSANSLKFFKE